MLDTVDMTVDGGQIMQARYIGEIVAADFNSVQSSSNFGPFLSSLPLIDCRALGNVIVEHSKLLSIF